MKIFPGCKAHSKGKDLEFIYIWRYVVFNFEEVEASRKGLYGHWFLPNSNLMRCRNEFKTYGLKYIEHF